jgi:putative hemolysin
MPAQGPDRSGLAARPLPPSSLVFEVTRAADDIRAAQALRHRVFVEEMGAAPGSNEGREADRFDATSEHLILRDPARPEAGVVATLRLGRGERGFYTAEEFDIAPLVATGAALVEMGRACLHPEYRGGAAAFALFGGMHRHLRATGAEIVFGAASFPGADPAPHIEALRHLRARHLAPAPLRPRAVGPAALAVEGAPGPGADKGIPSLIKAYLRSGAWVGEGAWIDRAFNTVDICMVLDLTRATPGGGARRGGGVRQA